MGLDFSRVNTQSKEQATNEDTTLAKSGTPEEPIVESYDIVADRQKLNSELVASQEVDSLVSKIDIGDMQTIVAFGGEVAEEISKASDIVLGSMDLAQLEKSSAMLAQLNKIMSQFDIEEIREEKGIKKLFSNAKKQLDKLLAKYHTMGDEVDKIYVELRKYEDEIKHSNKNLTQMFEANVNYYHELVKYILAGEQGCREIQA